MNPTGIEWVRNADGTDGHVWNPLRARNKKTGRRGKHCEHVHEGCRFCWAEAINVRDGDSGGTGLEYKPGNRDKVDLYLDEKTLLHPLAKHKATRVFVCSTTDPFGAWVTDEQRDKMFAVMGLCPQHTFIILTKRPKEARDYLTTRYRRRAITGRVDDIVVAAGLRTKISMEHFMKCFDGDGPFPNIWLVVSCSEQKDADAFVPILLDTPVAKRGLSLEPLLGPIDLGEIEAPEKVAGQRWTFDALSTGDYYYLHDDLGRGCGGDGPYREHRIDWVIAGGESGAKHEPIRPMHPDWLRDLRDQCKAADVPFFFKQWGEWAPGECADHPQTRTERVASYFDGRWSYDALTPAVSVEMHRDDGPDVWRFGKRRAGRSLDGVEHNEFPETTS